MLLAFVDLACGSITFLNEAYRWSSLSFVIVFFNFECRQPFTVMVGSGVGDISVAFFLLENSR